MTLLCVALGLIWPRWQRVRDVHRLRECFVDVEFVTYETSLTFLEPEQTSLSGHDPIPGRESLWAYLDRYCGSGFFSEIQSFSLSSWALLPLGGPLTPDNLEDHAADRKRLRTAFEIIAKYPEIPCEFSNRSAAWHESKPWRRIVIFSNDDTETFAALGGYPQITEVTIAKKDFTARDAEIILRFPNVVKILFTRREGDSEGMGSLLDGLDRLRHSNKIEEIDYRPFRSFDLTAPVTELEAICRLPNLKRLTFRRDDLTFDRIRAIGDAVKLERLRLSRVDVVALTPRTERMQLDDPLKSSIEVAPKRNRFDTWKRLVNLRHLATRATDLTRDDIACLHRVIPSLTINTTAEIDDFSADWNEELW